MEPGSKTPRINTMLDFNIWCFNSRVFPAIDINRSGTRREELLLKPDVLQKMWVLRKLCYPMDDLEAMEFLLDKVKSTKGNAEFFDAMRRG